MPSSTSSSRPKGKQPSWADQRIPSQHWGKTLLVSALIFVFGVGLIEAYGRYLGFQPSLRDNAGLWSLNRDRATGNALVVVGSSRAQLGIDLNVMSHSVSARDVIQLSINGSSSLLVLENLADDPNFNGSVLFEINPIYFFFTDQEPNRINRAAEKLMFHASSSAWQPIEQHLLMAVQSRYVFGMPQLAPQQLLKKWASGQHPEPDIFTLDANRWRQADYQSLSVEKQNRLAKRQRKYYPEMGDSTCEETLPVLIERLKSAVNKIKAKGGSVALFRMPSSGEILKREQQRCPRRSCWDNLVNQTDLASVHFLDLDSLAALTLADESHVDQKDAILVTQSVITHLEEKGFNFN